MSSEDNDEYEEERAVVMVELQGVIDPENLFHQHSSFKLLGIETDEPILQLGNYTFSGEYEDTPGTVVFFEKPSQDSKSAEYFCKTDKKLLMKRVFLEKKMSEPPNATSEVSNAVEVNIDGFNGSHSNQSGNVEDNCDLEINMLEAAQETQNLQILESGHDEQTCVVNGHPEPQVQSSLAQVPQNLISHSQDVEMEEAEETVEAIERAVQALISQEIPESQEEASGEVMAVSTSSVAEGGSGISDIIKLPTVVNGDVIDVNDSEAVADVSDSEVSGESADFIILSETDGSNEISEDSNSNSQKRTVADSSDCRPTTSGQVAFHSPEVSNSESAATASCSNDANISSFAKKLIPDVQLVSSVDTGASTSKIDQEMECEDVADSASHLIKDPISRISDSSLPIICDSASNGKRDGVSEGSGYDNSMNTDEVRRNANDSAEIQSTSEAVGMAEEDDDVEVEFVDVFDDESIGQSDGHVSHSHEQQGVCSSRGEPQNDSAGHVNYTDEAVETSQMEVSGSGESQINFASTQEVRESGSRVNSTVGETSASEQGTCDSANTSSVSVVGDAGAGTSRDTGFQSTEQQKFFVSKSKDSVDSTSNQVISCNQNEENLNLVAGIDSTSEHQNTHETYRESEESMELNLNSVPNDAIDSTMNKFSSSNQVVEEMDFEMREANDSGNEESEIVVHRLTERAQSIDSTSGMVIIEDNQPNPTCSTADLAVPSSYDHSNNLPCAEESVCEVSESCSEGSPMNAITESRTVDRDTSSPICSVYSDDNGESSSSCRVTESHMDENRNLYSYNDTQFPGSSRGNSSVSEVTESIAVSGTVKSCVTDSDSKEISEVTESLSVAYHENSSSSQDDSDLEETELRPSSSKQFVSYSNEESRPESEEEEVSSRVTESSSSHKKQRNVPLLSHLEDYCTNAVTDSTNVSNLSEQSTDQASSFRNEDSSQCEVTESSSSCSHLHIVSEESSNSVSGSSGATASHSSEVTHSFFDIGASTSAEVSESAALCENTGPPLGDFNTTLITSGDQREPSSSDVVVTSASGMYATATSSVVNSSLTSANFSAGSAVGYSANEANAHVDDMEVEEISVEEIIHEPSDSSESNAADSTEGNSSSAHQNQHSRSGSGDSSKLPSSTSN